MFKELTALTPAEYRLAFGRFDAALNLLSVEGVIGGGTH